MALTKHYLQDTQTEGGTGTDIYDLDRTQNTDATLSKNVNNAGYEIGYEAQMTVNDEPNSTSYSCSVDIASFTGTLSWRYRVQRVNSSNVVQDSSSYSTVRDETDTGISTDTLTLTNDFVTGDRLRISFEWKRDADHGNVTLEFRVQDADSWIEVDVVLPATADHNQREFRIRSTDPAINANGGGDWHAAINVDATIDLDTFFRIRFDIEETEGAADGGVTYKLQASKEGGAYADVDVMTSTGTTPLADTWPPVTQIDSTDVVQIVASATFSNDAVTTDLLAAKSGFVSGAGMHDNLSPSVSLLANGHTELEWSLVIPRYYEGGFGNANDDGDTFDFRVVESDGTLFTGDTNSGYDEIPRITANLAVGHMGGTHIEQPSLIGPFKDGNGNLYGITEQVNTSPWNVILMHKSIDGGDTWAEATQTGRPTHNDPEGTGVRQISDDELLIITRDGADEVNFHRFRMSSHASPDTWNQIDIVIDADAGNPDFTESESADIIQRVSDGFIFVAYNGHDGPDDVIWINRSEDGGATWETRAAIQDTGRDYVGVKMVLGPTTDDIYVFVNDPLGSDMYFDTIDTLATAVSGTLTTVIANETGNTGQVGDNIVPPVAYDDEGVEVVWVGWNNSGTTGANGPLRAVAIRDTSVGTPADVSTDDVARSFGASHQPVASFALDGKEVHALWAERVSLDIFSDSNIDEGGWGTDTEEQDAVTCHYIHGQVFTHSSGNGGNTVLGYIWETGTEGKSPGFVRYDEIVLAVGGTVYPPFPRRQKPTVRM